MTDQMFLRVSLSGEDHDLLNQVRARGAQGVDVLDMPKLAESCGVSHDRLLELGRLRCFVKGAIQATVVVSE